MSSNADPHEVHQQIAERRRAINEKLSATQEKNANKTVERFNNKQRAKLRKFQPGDMVYVCKDNPDKIRNKKIRGAKAKLESLFFDFPAEVVEVLKNGRLKIKWSDGAEEFKAANWLRLVSSTTDVDALESASSEDDTADNLDTETDSLREPELSSDEERIEIPLSIGATAAELVHYTKPTKPYIYQTIEKRTGLLEPTGNPAAVATVVSEAEDVAEFVPPLEIITPLPVQQTPDPITIPTQKPKKVAAKKKKIVSSSESESESESDLEKKVIKKIGTRRQKRAEITPEKTKGRSLSKQFSEIIDGASLKPSNTNTQKKSKKKN